jgi:hypothetical protein
MTGLNPQALRCPTESIEFFRYHDNRGGGNESTADVGDEPRVDPVEASKRPSTKFPAASLVPELHKMSQDQTH